MIEEQGELQTETQSSQADKEPEQEETLEFGVEALDAEIKALIKKKEALKKEGKLIYVAYVERGIRLRQGIRDELQDQWLREEIAKDEAVAREKTVSVQKTEPGIRESEVDSVLSGKSKPPNSPLQEQPEKQEAKKAPVRYDPGTAFRSRQESRMPAHGRGSREL